MIAQDTRPQPLRGCRVKLLSKIQRDGLTAAGSWGSWRGRGVQGLYLEIFNFSLGLQRPCGGEKKRKKERVGE